MAKQASHMILIFQGKHHKKDSSTHYKHPPHKIIVAPDNSILPHVRTCARLSAAKRGFSRKPRSASERARACGGEFCNVILSIASATMGELKAHGRAPSLPATHTCLPTICRLPWPSSCQEHDDFHQIRPNF